MKEKKKALASEHAPDWSCGRNAAALYIEMTDGNEVRPRRPQPGPQHELRPASHNTLPSLRSAAGGRDEQCTGNQTLDTSMFDVLFKKKVPQWKKIETNTM